MGQQAGMACHAIHSRATYIGSKCLHDIITSLPNVSHATNGSQKLKSLSKLPPCMSQLLLGTYAASLNLNCRPSFIDLDQWHSCPVVEIC